MALMNQKQYAEHCKVNPSYISHLKAKGFLETALVFIPGKKYAFIDSALADKSLAENLDRAFSRGSGVTTKDIGKLLTGKVERDSFAAARTESERIRVKQLRQKIEIKQDLYISREQVSHEAALAGKLFKDTFASIAARIAARIAAETDEHAILRILHTEHEQALKKGTMKLITRG